MRPRCRPLFRHIFDKQTFLINVGLFGFSASVSIYAVFQIKIFEEKYKISLAHFSIAQTLFLVWNAVNDPLFGYAQDVGCGVSWIMDRRKVMLYVGPLLSLSFLLFYFPWTTNLHPKWVIGVQYFVSLFVFDSLLTLVLSAYCGMCVEIGSSRLARVRAVVYGEVAALIGGLVIYPVSYYSKNLDEFGTFQVMCVYISLFSAACYIVTGLLSDPQKFSLRATHCEHVDDGSVPSSGSSLLTTVYQSMRISWQVLRERNFLCAVFGQFFRNARYSFAEGFTIIVVEHLISPNGILLYHSHSLSAFLAVSRVLPMILFIILWPLNSRFGPWLVNSVLGVSSIVNCVIALSAGQNNAATLVVFLLLENLLTRCGHESFYVLFLGHVVDDDMRIYKRKAPMSAVLFTLKALLNKPAEQLTNIIATNIFARGGYEEVRGRYACTNMAGNYTLIKLPGANGTEPLSSVRIDCPTLLNTMFMSATVFPLVCAALELFIMAWFGHRSPRRPKKIDDVVDRKTSGAADTGPRKLTSL